MTRNRKGKHMLLGIDVGTTGAKAMVFTEEGGTRGYAFREYGILYTKEGYACQDAEKVWEITKEVIREAVREEGQNIRSISVSVQGDAVIPVDRDRTALARAQLGMDYRGREEARMCADRFGACEIFSRTGMRPHPMNSFIKILWIKRHDECLYEKTYKFVTYADFIMGKLGSSEIVIDYTMAGRTQAFDLSGRTWSKEILKAFDIQEEKLGTPVPSGTVVGTIDRALAGELGICPGAALVAGGHDQTCAAVGAGITEEGMALDSHGTAEVLTAVSEGPKLGSVMFDSFYPCYIHALPGLYATFALNHTGGALLRWFVEEYCREDRRIAAAEGISVYDHVMEQLPEGPSHVMVLPYLNGSGTPYCDLEMKGGILGLTLATGRYDIAKAVLEALCFEMRLNMDQMKEAGIAVRTVRCAGGGARSRTGLKLKADIMGVPVTTLKVREAACFGAAILAGRGAGLYQSAADIQSLVQTDVTYEPDKAREDLYDERYRVYRGLYRTMKPVMARVGEHNAENIQ